MADRWFSEDELEEMSRPTMDRAIEAIERGDLEAAKALCEEMKHEWRLLHDLMVDGMAGLISFVQARLGDDGVEEAWTYSLERGWKGARGGDLAAGPQVDGARAGRELARPLVQRDGPAPGRVHDRRGRREVHVRDEPVRLGPAAVADGRLRGARTASASPSAAHDWSYGREGFPLYCTHCTFMNELLPIRWIGHPVYPSDPPEDFDRDPCTWYWYKDPADIPARHWERYGDAGSEAAAQPLP